jgi:ADP-heptose:LPS heptosyltransferase
VQQWIQAGSIEQPLKSPDWLQTAAVMDGIDLLVSVDTSVAHLAGAMGVPTVMLLSAPADWRWGQSGERTFLYDSLRLARCARPGDWQGALEQADRLVGQMLRRSPFLEL